MASWYDTLLKARIWCCGDEECDCTQPVIERIRPNLRAGYPWIHRETVWEGEFLTGTWQYGPEERETLQFAPLREECRRIGIPVPADV